MLQSREEIHFELLFSGDINHGPGRVFAEASDLHECAIHVYSHASTDSVASVYLDPIGATHLAAQLLTAARQSFDRS